MHLETLHEWMQFLSSDNRSLQIDSITAHAYGEGDDSYLVIEKQVEDSPATIDQYVIHAQSDSNKLYGLLQFLEKNKFSMTRIEKDS